MFGAEIWCNLEGRYTHIIADYTDNIDYITSQYICSLGIMGTRYVRDTEIVDEIELSTQDIITLEIPHIYSELVIGNTLDI